MTLNSFSAGVNTSFSSELNENFDMNSIQAYTVAADTTEYSVNIATGGDMGYTKTFTPPQGVNAKIIGLRLKFDVKCSSSSADGGIIAILTNNTNGKTITFTNNAEIFHTAGGATSRINIFGDAYQNTTYSSKDEYATAENIDLSNVHYSGSNTVVANIGKALGASLGGTTYTLTITATATRYDSVGTLYLDNIKPTLYFTHVADEVTSGWS